MCASVPPSTARGITVKNKRNAEIKTVSGQRPRPLRRSRASSPKVGALGSPRKLHLFAKASPFEERLPPAGGRCRAATKGGVWHGEAVTERARTLKQNCRNLLRWKQIGLLHIVLCSSPELCSDFYQPNSCANQLTVVSAAVSTVVSTCWTVCCSLVPSASLSDQ